MMRWLRSAYVTQKNHAPERGLAHSARARGLMCQLRPPTPSKRCMSRGTGAPALAVTKEVAQHSSLLLRARLIALVVVGSCPSERHCAGERPFSFGARPWCDVPAAVSNAKPASRVLRCAGAPTIAATREEAQHSSLLLRARLSALVVVGPCPLEGHCSGERPRSFGARPWCDVPAAISNAKPASRVSCGAGAPTIAATREEAQHSGLLRVRAFQRWLWSTYALYNAIEPARGLFSSARARGATC